MPHRDLTLYIKEGVEIVPFDKYQVHNINMFSSKALSKRISKNTYTFTTCSFPLDIDIFITLIFTPADYSLNS